MWLILIQKRFCVTIGRLYRLAKNKKLSIIKHDVFYSLKVRLPLRYKRQRGKRQFFIAPSLLCYIA